MERMSGNLGFEEDVLPLVGEGERMCMSSVPRGAFDLWTWADVRPRASLILKHLRAEDGLLRMPPAGWPVEKIAKFEYWAREGAPKRRGDTYADFFRSIDAQTEYYDVYGAREGLEDMGPFYSTFFAPALLKGVWFEYINVVPSTQLLKKKKRDLWDRVLQNASDPAVLNGLLKIDEWLCGLVMTHFGNDGVLDTQALFDAFSRFGMDTLPADEDRADRVRSLGDPNDYRLTNNLAPYHRMDTRVMWFFWFGHIQCVFAVLAGGDDTRRSIRSALLAAIFTGQAFDTAYRQGSNGLTRPGYAGTGGASSILSTAEILRDDPESAIVEIEELFLIWSGLVPPS